MYDIVDELQICSHITQLQAQQLYALVRVAMGLQYKARLRLPSSSSSRRRSIRPIAHWSPYDRVGVVNFIP
jgi:hypothetical protein